MYKIRRLLTMGAELLKPRMVERIDEKLRAGDPDWEVTIAWDCYQALRRVYQAETGQEGATRFETLVGKFASCPVPEVKRWRKEILAQDLTALGAGVDIRISERVTSIVFNLAKSRIGLWLWVASLAGGVFSICVCNTRLSAVIIVVSLVVVYLIKRLIASHIWILEGAHIAISTGLFWRKIEVLPFESTIVSRLFSLYLLGFKFNVAIIYCVFRAGRVGLRVASNLSELFIHYGRMRRVYKLRTGHINESVSGAQLTTGPVF